MKVEKSDGVNGIVTSSVTKVSNLQLQIVDYTNVNLDCLLPLAYAKELEPTSAENF